LSPIGGLFEACDVELGVVLQNDVLLTLKAFLVQGKLCELLLLFQYNFYCDVCSVLQHKCCIQKVNYLGGQATDYCDCNQAYQTVADAAGDIDSFVVIDQVETVKNNH
jgi:hypothetical protein